MNETPSVPKVRSRIPWFGSSSKPTIPIALEPVARATESRKDVDLDLLVRAFRVADKAHAGQTRKSGEPYITHPVAVATILAELGLGTETIVAGLLHDVVEDTEFSLETLAEEFGQTVADLVDGVTKLDKVVYGEAAQSETVRKMVIAMAKDIRVLMIKLADRLHNARTWKYVPAQSAKKKARETLEIYAPLAHRLGMNSIKWELEDLSFRTIYPKVYEEIERLVQERAPEREKYLDEVSRQIEADIRTNKIRGTVSGRPKHYYSIYQKMIVRGRDFDDIFDLVGVRVLVDSIKDCYGTLGIIHARWKPIPGRFKDYISMPKFNLYQSLHTTVVGPEGKPVEIQIRTYEMHRRAEFGIAAHWRYKQNPNAKSVSEAPGGQAQDQLSWLRQIVDWQRETSDPTEFLDSLRYDLSGQEVFVFTPKGDVKELPVGSTPIDFAYSVHTEIGHRLVGAKINGRLMPLSTKLTNGDKVEIITSKSEDAGPSREWLNFVASGRARNKINQWFSRTRRDEAIEKGQDAIGNQLRKQNKPIHRLMSFDSMSMISASMGFNSIDDLYAAIGSGKISPAHVVKELIEDMGGESGTEETLAEATVPGKARGTRPDSYSSSILVDGTGESNVWVKLAKCCTPVPGDEIIGFTTRGQGISVHRTDCNNVIQMGDQSERFIEVNWSGGPVNSFIVQLQVESLDRTGLINDITRVMTDHAVNILSASMSTRSDHLAIFRFTFETSDAVHINKIINAIKRIEGIIDAYRYTGKNPRIKNRGKATHK